MQEVQQLSLFEVTPLMTGATKEPPARKPPLIRLNCKRCGKAFESTWRRGFCSESCSEHPATCAQYYAHKGQGCAVSAPSKYVFSKRAALEAGKKARWVTFAQLDKLIKQASEARDFELMDFMIDLRHHTQGISQGGGTLSWAKPETAKRFYTCEPFRETSGFPEISKAKAKDHKCTVCKRTFQGSRSWGDKQCSGACHEKSLETPKAKQIAHVKILHGKCTTCGHYGDDCTGTEPGEEKQCPKCKHVGPINTDFGTRVMNGKLKAQSYCLSCRSSKGKYDDKRTKATNAKTDSKRAANARSDASRRTRATAHRPRAGKAANNTVGVSNRRNVRRRANGAGGR